MDKDTLTNNYVSHGSEWPEHEDYLVGNKEGLEALIKSINEAIENGESKNDLYEFVGVRCLETKFFETDQHETSSSSELIGWLIVLAIGFVFISGVITIIKWIF